MGLLDALRKRRSVARAKRGDLWAEYRAILERLDQPRKADAKRMEDLMTALSVGLPHAELHSLVLQRATTARTALDTHAGAEKQLEAADAELRRANKRIFEAYQAQGKVYQRYSQAEQACRQFDQAQHALRLLERRFPALLRGDETATPLAIGFTMCPLELKRKELGCEPESVFVEETLPLTGDASETAAA